MPWHDLLRLWFPAKPPPPLASADEAEGEHLRAAVREHARVKADNTRCYEARVQSMIEELFLRMGEGHARHDP